MTSPEMVAYTDSLKAEFGSLDHPDAQRMLMASAVLSFVADERVAEHYRLDIFKAWCAYVINVGKLKGATEVIDRAAEDENMAIESCILDVIMDADERIKERWTVLRNIMDVAHSERKEQDDK